MKGPPHQAPMHQLHSFIEKQAPRCFARDLALGKLVTAMHKYGQNTCAGDTPDGTEIKRAIDRCMSPKQSAATCNKDKQLQRDVDKAQAAHQSNADAKAKLLDLMQKLEIDDYDQAKCSGAEPTRSTNSKKKSQKTERSAANKKERVAFASNSAQKLTRCTEFSLE